MELHRHNDVILIMKSKILFLLVLASILFSGCVVVPINHYPRSRVHIVVPVGYHDYGHYHGRR